MSEVRCDGVFVGIFKIKDLCSMRYKVYILQISSFKPFAFTVPEFKTVESKLDLENYVPKQGTSGWLYYLCCRAQESKVLQVCEVYGQVPGPLGF